MANKVKITIDQLHEYYEGFDHFLPEGKPSINAPFRNWKNLKDFEEDVESHTGVDIKSESRKSIKDSQQILESLVSGEVAGNVPSKSLRESQAAEAEKSKEAHDQAVRNAKVDVERMIEKQKELHERLVKTKPRIYAKIEDPKIEVSENTRSKIKQLKDANIPQLTQGIEDSLKSFKGQVSDEEIHLLAYNAAVKGVEAANYINKNLDEARQSAILEAVSKNEEVLQKVIGDKTSVNGIQNASSELSVFQKLQTVGPKSIWKNFDKEMADALFPSSVSFKVSLSETQLPGYSTTIAPEGLIQGYSTFLSSNAEFFGRLVDLPIDKFKEELMSKATTWLSGQVASNFPELASFIASPETQTLMASLGIGTVEIPVSTLGFAIPETSLPVVNFLSSGYGITFTAGGAVTGAALATSTAATAQSIALTGGIMASEAFLGGAGGAAAGAAAGAATGPGAVVAVPLLAAAGAIFGKVAKDSFSKIQRFLRENNLSDLVLAIPAAALVGGFFGIPLGIGAGLLTYGVSAFAGGGLSAIQAGLSGFGSGVVAFIDVLWGTFLAGIAGPIIGFLIGFPIFVAIVLLIINSGAYVVPPGQSLTTSTNPYISVEKVAEPSGQLPSPTSITYRVTITAKKDSLSGITIQSDCHAIKKSGSISCPAEQIPSPPDSINAGTPFSFTFTSSYDNTYQDSLVSDSITVNAKSVSGGNVSETGSASVCFGKCPLDCFNFPDKYWPSGTETYKNNLIAAVGTLASGNYAPFAEKACANGTINVCYKTSFKNSAGPNCDGGSYGYNEGSSSCDIDLNKCGITTPNNALYILTHETTHVIQNRKGGGHLQAVFDDYVPSPYTICTYVMTQGNDAESMAEADALFVANPTIYKSCSPPVTTSNYSQRYPKQYSFAKNCMFSSVCKGP